MAVLLALLGIAGCSDAEGRGSTEPSVPRLRDVERLGTTTTTAVPGTARTVDDYEAAGADAGAATCLVAARLDRDLAVELPVEPGGPILLRLLPDDPDADDPDAALDGAPPLATLGPGVTSSVDVQRVLLAALAPDCLGPAAREVVADRLGRADDDVALAEDLPAELDRRRGTGASAEELACLDRGYRAAPARLGSLAADRRVVEVGCISAARLEMMRRAGIAAGLAEAGASEEERSCLVTADDDLAVLSDTMAGAAGGIGVLPTDDQVRCVTGQRLGEIAVAALARQVDFGGEELVVVDVAEASGPDR